MAFNWRLAGLLLPLLVSGCTALSGARGRVAILVLMPVGLIMAALWLMRGRGQGPQGPVYPDDDRRDDGMGGL